MQAFTIPGRLPGLNEYTRANRSHAVIGARMKREAEAEVMWAATDAKLDRITVPVEVRIDWYEETTRRDLDNIAFAVKFILDALVKHGTLRDDNRSCVTGIAHRVFVDRENPRIEVALVPVGEAV